MFTATISDQPITTSS